MFEFLKEYATASARTTPFTVRTPAIAIAMMSAMIPSLSKREYSGGAVKRKLKLTPSQSLEEKSPRRGESLRQRRW